jgi:nanoRNase/pAp phosphatase (c-di-AMP/oligoRNAs hydrolase)
MKESHLGNIVIRAPNPIHNSHVLQIRRSLCQGPVLITTHENPDPDALAAGKAIHHLIHAKWGLPTSLVFSGNIGRAENKAMYKLLTPEWEPISTINDTSRYTAIVYIDCQPGIRNTILLSDTTPMVVIDHHTPKTERSNQAKYADIRAGIGSTSTMVYQYLEAAQAKIDRILATALFLGIQSDTNGLSRGSSIEDGIIYAKLLDQIDSQLLLQIQTAGLAREYYEAFYNGIQNARIFGKAIVSHLGMMHRADLPAELADLLFRYDQAQITLCSGYFNNVLYFSIRSTSQDASRIAQNMVVIPGQAGGHATMAGGQIPVISPSPNFVLELEDRFLSAIGESEKGIPLLSSNLSHDDGCKRNHEN